MKKYTLYTFAVICSLALFVSCKTTKSVAEVTPVSKQGFSVPLLSEAATRKFDYFFLESQKYKSRGDHAAAYELLTKCLEINPYAAEVLSQLSVYTLRMGDKEKSIDMLKKAVHYDEDNYTYKSNLAGYYLNNNESIKTIAVAQDMAEQFPNKLEPLLILAHLYTENEEYDQAIKALDRIELLDGKSEMLTQRKVAIYLQANKNEEAYAEMKSLINEYPDELSYRNRLGDLYLMNGKKAEALKIFESILKESPEYEPTLVSVTQYYKEAGDTLKYENYMNRLLYSPTAKNTVKIPLLETLMQEHYNNKDSTKILGIIQKTLEVPQQDATLAMLCAHYLTIKGMKKEVKPILHKILEIEPENKVARLELLSYAVSENNKNEIIAIATPTIQYHPSALEFYYYLGLSHFMNDETDKSLEVFQKATQNISADTNKDMASEIYALLGDIYHQAKKNAEAFAAYDSSLVYNPNNVSAMNNYAYFLSLEKKNLDKAEEMSHKTVKAEPQNATYLDTYAYILFIKKKYTEARIYIDQAIQNKEEQSQEVLEHAGDIYYMIGEKEKAVTYWEQALKIEEPDRVPPRPKAEIEKLKRKIQQKRYIE